MSTEFLAIVSFLALAFSIWVLILTILFFIRVPKHLEDISLTLKRMYLFGNDDDDDNDDDGNDDDGNDDDGNDDDDIFHL